MTRTKLRRSLRLEDLAHAEAIDPLVAEDWLFGNGAHGRDPAS